MFSLFLDVTAAVAMIVLDRLVSKQVSHAVFHGQALKRGQFLKKRFLPSMTVGSPWPVNYMIQSSFFHLLCLRTTSLEMVLK